ncbi:MAG: hypothetical protein ACJ74Z_07455 [Bryobacteraceae bacterium]
MSLDRFNRFGITAVFLVAGQALGQTSAGTSVDLRGQGRNPDFSKFVFTRPMTVGAVLPASCQLGQFYFNSAASAGANVFACTAPNAWTLESGSGASNGAGAIMAAQLGDFAAVLANGTLSVGVGCSVTNPCNARLGNTVYNFRTSAVVTPAGSSSGLVLLYIDGAGNLTAGSTVPLTCQQCVYASGVTSFPANSIPLFTWTLTSGGFDAAGATDFRALLSSKNLLSGRGIVMSENGGTSTIAVDTSVIATQVFTPPATSSDACSAGQFSWDDNYYYLCTGSNTWKRIALSSF